MHGSRASRSPSSVYCFPRASSRIVQPPPPRSFGCSGSLGSEKQIENNSEQLPALPQVSPRSPALLAASYWLVRTEFDFRAACASHATADEGRRRHHPRGGTPAADAPVAPARRGV